MASKIITGKQPTMTPFHYKNQVSLMDNEDPETIAEYIAKRANIPAEASLEKEYLVPQRLLILHWTWFEVHLS